jgi:uncharacterized protein YkwD
MRAFNPHRFIALASALAITLALVLAVYPQARAAEGYRIYAEELLANLPAGARFRPDLEARLNVLANNARATNDRSAMAASELLRDAARAQALEMLLGDFVGHTSESGYRFRARFEAFGGYERGTFGENAARDRQDGPVDMTKADRLFQQWIDSTGHRRNLMKRDYRFVSTGVIESGHHLYAIQIYWER